MNSITPGNNDVSAHALNQLLVDGLKNKGHIRTPRIEEAFRSVPRHLFLPGVPLEEAYCDEAISIKQINNQHVSTSSAPFIMAEELEHLQLELGHAVLEIGAGSGYNAAILANIVGETGKVVTADI